MGLESVVSADGALPVVRAVVVLPGVHFASNSRARPPAINDSNECVTVKELRIEHRGRYPGLLENQLKVALGY